MRESIGGTMLFWIVLFFLSIFITFLAFVMKYAQVYKMKNSMINFIEQQEGIETVDQFYSQLYNLGYPRGTGAYICKNTVMKDDTVYGVYYTVQLYSVLKMPLVHLAAPIGIKGETRMIKTGVLKNGTDNENIPNCSGS